MAFFVQKSIILFKKPAQAAGQLEIPEHDAITRRKQFRTKKQKAEKKQAAKEAKKENKRKQHGEKQEKVKKDKKMDKKGKTGEPKKKFTKKNKKTKKVQESASETAPEKACQEDVKNHDAVEATHGQSDTEKPLESMSASKHSPTKGSKLKKYRKMKKSKDNEKKKASQATKETEPALVNRVKETKAKKNNKSTKEGVADESPKRKGELKKKNSIKDIDSTMVDDSVHSMVSSILEECKSSGCTHPSFEKLTFDRNAFQLSTYWSRNCVGVKMSAELIPESKGKGKSTSGKSRFKQIAYFSCLTSCTYTNLALAQSLAPSLKWCMMGINQGILMEFTQVVEPKGCI